MKAINTFSEFTGKLGTLIGRGLIAGLAGTAAITLSQIIEMKLSKRSPGFAPADAASKALGIEAATRENRKKFSNEVHWAYGTAWGVPRAILTASGVEGWPASAIHYAAIFYTALTIQPDFEVSPPVDEWSKKDIAVYALHHIIYASVAGWVFDAINQKKNKS